MRYRGRFAPSPTGGLHLGNLFVAFCSWARAYRAGGVCILRMEDLDGPRVVVGAAQEIIEDLNYIGLTFAEGPPKVDLSRLTFKVSDTRITKKSPTNSSRQNEFSAAVAPEKEYNEWPLRPTWGKRVPSIQVPVVKKA